MMKLFKVTVEVEVEAESHASAAITVEDAVTDMNRKKLEARSPVRLSLVNVTVEAPKPRK
jgi:hypothetical protein